MMDRKTATILVLFALLVVFGAGWLNAERSKLPKNIQGQPQFFHGYEAYLDRRIHCTPFSGNSMRPTINDGDSVLWVEIENVAELKVGDIIIYANPRSGEITGHRIIRIIKENGKYRFETKGDNLPESDAQTHVGAYLVSEDDIKGLIIGVIYHG